MSWTSALTFVGKALAGTVRGVAKAAPAVSKFVATKAAPIIGEEAAKTAGKAAGFVTAMAITKAVDKATDAVIRPIPGMGKVADEVIDLTAEFTSLKDFII